MPAACSALSRSIAAMLALSLKSIKHSRTADRIGTSIPFAGYPSTILLKKQALPDANHSRSQKEQLMRPSAIAFATVLALALPANAAQSGPGYENPQSQSSGGGQSQNLANQPQSGNYQSSNRPSQQRQAQSTVSPRSLNRNQIRQIQTALSKAGFDAGSPDGIWGPKSRTALRDFQKNEGMRANDRLTRRELADLGLKGRQIMSNAYGSSRPPHSPSNQ